MAKNYVAFLDDENRREARQIEIDGLGRVINSPRLGGDWTPCAVDYKRFQVGVAVYIETVNALTHTTSFDYDKVVRVFEYATNKVTSENMLESLAKAHIGALEGSEVAMIAYAAISLVATPYAAPNLDFSVDGYEGYSLDLTFEIVPIVEAVEVVEVVEAVEAVEMPAIIEHDKGILIRTANGYRATSNSVANRYHYASLDGCACGCWGFRRWSKCWHTAAIQQVVNA